MLFRVLVKAYDNSAKGLLLLCAQGARRSLLHLASKGQMCYPDIRRAQRLPAAALTEGTTSDDHGNCLEGSECLTGPRVTGEQLA